MVFEYRPGTVDIGSSQKALTGGFLMSKIAFMGMIVYSRGNQHSSNHLLFHGTIFLLSAGLQTRCTKLYTSFASKTMRKILI